MRVFVTGATGFIGSAIVPELINAGHQVVGLARSDASADKLIAAGAEVLRGDLEDLDSLRKGAADADGVIHAGFIHDFSRFAEVCKVDQLAIETMGDVLAGTNKPLVVTSGTALVSHGQLATENIIPVVNENWPRRSEEAADALAEKGIHASIVRLSPSVHGEGDHHGFIPIMISTARQKGSSAYIGEGANQWNAVHRLDAAVLFRLALENAGKGSRYHAVGDEGIDLKTIAGIIGQHLNLPVVSITPEAAVDHFGWFAIMAGIDCPASSKLTQENLNWHPIHPGLIADLEQGIYFKS